eukprot:14923785-Ditylum_brightwellii.AAC.1
MRRFLTYADEEQMKLKKGVNKIGTEKKKLRKYRRELKTPSQVYKSFCGKEGRQKRTDGNSDGKIGVVG